MKPDQAIAFFLNQTATALAAGASQAAVSRWLQAGEIPLEAQARLCVESKGELKLDYDLIVPAQQLAGILTRAAALSERRGIARLAGESKPQLLRKQEA